MIVAIVALTACCACSKVNDIDKRLGVLENIVSDLKAQISAGAVITSVDKTSDGCTFTLSNGQIYTVTNGKDGTDGTDGEAIIADVKIEEDFVVLALKDGEIMRISFQNPLSMVTLDIVPDFDYGTVKEPKTSEAMGMKSSYSIPGSSGPDVPNDSAEDIIVVNGHKAVKLGGTYWGTENVGAITDLSRIDNVYGAYFRKELGGTDFNPTHIAAGSWGTNDDYRWTLPTKKQLNALKNDCYWEWQGNYNGSGMNGYIIYKAKNDADKGKVGGIESYSTDTDIYIFLPAAGYYDIQNEGTWTYKGRKCCYWILDESVIYAYDIVNDGKWSVGCASYNSYGIDGPVRPVAVPK